MLSYDEFRKIGKPTLFIECEPASDGGVFINGLMFTPAPSGGAPEASDWVECQISEPCITLGALEEMVEETISKGSADSFDGEIGASMCRNGCFGVAGETYLVFERDDLIALRGLVNLALGGEE